MPEAQAPPATVKVKVKMDAKVIRGDSGEHGPPGSVEVMGTQYEKIVEITYEQAVEMVGKEEADKLFSGIERT
jgi:hypothetical protein